MGKFKVLTIKLCLYFYLYFCYDIIFNAFNVSSIFNVIRKCLLKYNFMETNLLKVWNKAYFINYLFIFIASSHLYVASIAFFCDPINIYIFYLIRERKGTVATVSFDDFFFYTVSICKVQERNINGITLVSHASVLFKKLF